jgi:hypothetical protein
MHGSQMEASRPQIEGHDVELCEGITLNIYNLCLTFNSVFEFISHDSIIFFLQNIWNIKDDTHKISV